MYTNYEYKDEYEYLRVKYKYFRPEYEYITQEYKYWHRAMFPGMPKKLI